MTKQEEWFKVEKSIWILGYDLVQNRFSLFVKLKEVALTGGMISFDIFFNNIFYRAILWSCPKVIKYELR